MRVYLQTQGELILREISHDLMNYLSNPLVEDEEWAQASTCLDEILQFSAILGIFHQETLNLTTYTLINECSNEKESILASYLHTLEKAFDTEILYHLDHERSVYETYMRHKQVNEALNRKSKLKTMHYDEPHENPSNLKITYVKRIILDHPIPWTTLSSLTLLNSLHYHTQLALRQNTHCIQELTPEWNKVKRIYTNHIHGMVLLWFELPIEFTCALTLKITRSSLIGFCCNLYGRPLSNAAWSDASQKFLSNDMCCFEDFNALCIQQLGTPSTLSTLRCTSPLNHLLETLNTLQDDLDSLYLMKLQIMRTMNMKLRTTMNTTTPLPMDFANSPSMKTLTSIYDFTGRISHPSMFSKQLPLISCLPKSASLDHLLIRWNLAHNIHSSDLYTFWNKDTPKEFVLNYHRILLNTPRIPLLPGHIPNCLNKPFGIEAQLDSDPLHSSFVNFTSMHEHHSLFNGMHSLPPATKTVYWELLGDHHDNLNLVMELHQHLQKLDYERNFIIVATLPRNTGSHLVMENLKRSKHVHKIGHYPPLSIFPNSIDLDGNFKTSTSPLSHELSIWFLHSPPSTLPSRITRSEYFTTTKFLHKRTPKFQPHPILSFGKKESIYKSKSESRKIMELIQVRKCALEKSPKDWDTYHSASADILELLPSSASTHSNVQRLLKSCEMKPELLPNCYFTPNAYIYAVINLKSENGRTYAGQMECIAEEGVIDRSPGRTSKELHYNECRNISLTP